MGRLYKFPLEKVEGKQGNLGKAAQRGRAGETKLILRSASPIPIKSVVGR